MKLPTSHLLRLPRPRQILRPLIIALCGLTSLALMALPGQAQTPSPEHPRALTRADLESSSLVLELHLDGYSLSDSLNAYQDGSQVLVPLGELARLLTLAITVRPEQGVASGFVIREEQSFALRLNDGVVALGDREVFFEPRMAQVIGDDIYVSMQMLSRWLPIDFEVDLPTLQLRVKPRVRLPLQERLAREGAASKLRKDGPAPRPVDYPEAISSIGLLGMPFIDQTIGGDAHFGPNTKQYRAAYSAYITSDVMGMEGSAYVTSTRDKPAPDVRMTLGRHDPEGELLGPLYARSLMLGHVSMPSVPQVMSGGPSGIGLLLSNRPLSQPSSFDRHSLRGDLPPGWDVTLYYNDSLVGYQGTSVNGQYAFEDLPLSFGHNDFRLVFNGPLGQIRVERSSFLLDQSIVKPGEFFYALAQQHADDGTVRSVAQFDLGLTQSVAGNAGLVRKPGLPGQADQTYAQVGLRAYGGQMIGSAQLTAGPHGGVLAEGSVKTRWGRYSLEFTHTQRAKGFVSDQFSAGSQGLKFRDQVRVNGGLSASSWLPAISLALEATRDQLESGDVNAAMSGRASTMLWGTSVSKSLRWQKNTAFSSTDGSVQLSRRVLGIGLSAQMDYGLQPAAVVQGMALTADRTLSSGYRINGGVLYTPSSNLTQVSGGVSKNLGAFSVALSGSYSNQNELVMGMQVFVATGRDPRSGRWFLDSQPLAGTGAASARVFVDKNGNGVRDEGEPLIPGASFLINGGGRHAARTDDQGVAFIGRLLNGQYADLSLDQSTLEDPQWKPRVSGYRLLPRPGQVELLEFPVVSSSEIEGVVYLLEKGGKRGIGDAKVELVDDAGQVVAMATSAGDGYYLLHQAPPGRMTIRISPDQAAKLKLGGALHREVTVPSEGDFITGQDLEMTLNKR
jgi:hypothetical protein